MLSLTKDMVSWMAMAMAMAMAATATVTVTVVSRRWYAARLSRWWQSSMASQAEAAKRPQTQNSSGAALLR